MTAESVTATVVAVLLVALSFAGMWLGWRRRGARHALPPLVAVADDGAAPLLDAEGRYVGTTVAGEWLDRVVARGLGTRSRVRLTLRPGGVDVHRPGAASFRIPAGAIRAARLDQGVAGKVVPPHGLLVVTWQHGELLLDTGFRLTRGAEHETWITAIDQLTKEPRS